MGYRFPYHNVAKTGKRNYYSNRHKHLLAYPEKPLPEKNRDHALSGDYIGCRECHITPDWLLIYEISHGELTLCLTRTGTHSDLFD